MVMMGGFYREWFAQRGLLTQAGCADQRRVYIWADNDQRTVETGHALAEGLLPGCAPETHALPAGKTDPLFDPLEAGMAKQDTALARAAVLGQVGPSLAALIETNRPAFEALHSVLTGGGKTRRTILDGAVELAPKDGVLAMSGPLNVASTLSEVMLLEYANGFEGAELGWGRLNKTNLMEAMRLHTEYADLMRRTPYLARMRGGQILRAVAASLQQAATGKPVQGALGAPSTRLAFISGHDTNISNLSGLLGLSWRVPELQKDDAPPGGALVFSLWKTAAGTRRVRVEFVAQTLEQMHRATPLSLAAPPAIAPLFAPGCGSAKEGYSCSLPAFQSVVRAALSAPQN